MSIHHSSGSGWVGEGFKMESIVYAGMDYKWKSVATGMVKLNHISRRSDGQTFESELDWKEIEDRRMKSIDKPIFRCRPHVLILLSI